MPKHRIHYTSPSRERAGLIAFLARWLRRFGDTTGATSVEHVLIMSVALTGAVGFKELGNKLQHQLQGEALHIEGKGMPRGGDLTSLAASFDAPELDCPGTVCSTPALSSPLDGNGTPGSSATPQGSPPLAGGAKPPPPPPPGLTPAQQDRKSDCEARLATSAQQYFPLKPESKVVRARPADRADAIARLCTEMVCECPSHKTDEECFKQWECIYGYVAQHPTSRYFDNAGVTDAAECPTGTNGHNQSIQAQCLSKQLKRWACEKTPKTGYVGDDVPELKTATIRPSRINTTATKRDPAVSQDAGDDAARIFRAANFADYDCVEGNGPNVFDMVCVQGDKVILVEAKGGGSDLGKRKNAAGTDYVQQGTLDYAYAIVAAMPAPDGGVDLAQKVQDALDRGTLRYFKVQQPFNKAGIAIRPEVEEFDLKDPNTVCPQCNCTGP
jgi:hypothetical protein